MRNWQCLMRNEIISITHFALRINFPCRMPSQACSCCGQRTHFGWADRIRHLIPGTRAVNKLTFVKMTPILIRASASASKNFSRCRAETIRRPWCQPCECRNIWIRRRQQSTAKTSVASDDCRARIPGNVDSRSCTCLLSPGELCRLGGTDKICNADKISAAQADCRTWQTRPH